MDHLEFAANESAALEPSAWDRWIAKAEKLIGHGLDGNEAEDGYSIDYALDAFNSGSTPHAYVTMVATRDRYRKPEAA